MRAAKNIPSRFSPEVMPSASATSATIDCGIIPSNAIGKAAIMQIKTPKTTPGITPIPKSPEFSAVPSTPISVAII